MEENKKIQLQQKIIDDLESKNNDLIAENDKLKKENEELTEKLVYEESKPKSGYEKAKALITELEKTKHEYEDLVIGLKKKQDECNQLLLTLKQMKIAYSKESNN